jgi:rhamnopyranosyl-N-acetylglucosaminyl-diphospho-decaprenol beta-1,3/1,4-galactofuranosyltransferase
MSHITERAQSEPAWSIAASVVVQPDLRIIAVITTYDRAVLLARCLAAIEAQHRPPDTILVVDDASPGSATAATIARIPRARHIRHAANRGGAAAYRTGIEIALDLGADAVWLMDDDGLPASPDCLARLLDRLRQGAEIAAPLVLDDAAPGRLAFPIRLRHRTRFSRDDLDGRERIQGFAHLFNGALIQTALFRRIGLPDPRFLCRGDEVEFLYRARRAGAAVCIDTRAPFLHPGAAPEIHPILGGAFYATVPRTEAKRRTQFRNRGHIFLAYRMWVFLVADVARYGCHFLLRRHPDPRGFRDWLAATAEGWRGRFLRQPTPPRPWVEVTRAATRDPEPALEAH